MRYTDPPMTLGNMHANGVRTLAIGCYHQLGPIR